MGDSTRKKVAKGSISIQSDKGWLRLRWSYEGKRYTLAIGLPDDPSNRIIAERKAHLIEEDLRLDRSHPGTFDRSLAKYKPQLALSRLNAAELFERFTQYKAKQVDPKTLDKYRGLEGYLKQYFKARDAANITEDDGFEFRDWLKPKLQPVTINERLGLLRACWKWGISKGLVKANPWVNVKIKVPPKQRPRPFTKEESRRILEGFKSDPTYNYYLDFVEFLLATGCRIGEAAGLRWGHLTEDCSGIWIGETWSRGRRKEPKTNKARAFQLSPRLQEMLRKRRPDVCDPECPVFCSPTGKPIDDHNFRNRAWKPILKRVGVEYRMPRNNRHTFVSHAVDQGLNPAEISAVTGHSPKVLMHNYLGNVGRAQLPELWDD